MAPITNNDIQPIVEKLKELREDAKDAGIIEDGVWTSMDELWTGPDLTLDQIKTLSNDMMESLRKAHLNQALNEGIVQDILELVKLMLPLALAAV